MMTTKKKAESKDATLSTLTGTAKVGGGVMGQAKDEAPKQAVPFPLDEGHYFALPVANRRGHAGQRPEDSVYIRMIQKALHVESTGRFDYATAQAVADWQKRQKVPVTRTVDQVTWESLIR